MISPPRQRLTTIAQVLFRKEIDYLDLTSALNAFKALCLEVSELDLESPENRENIALPNGKAIGPTWAGMCIDDLMRTKRFLMGIKKAVSSCSKTKENGTVHILYTGTGPFATLVLPLISEYGPEDIQFTLLEVNPVSFKSVQRVFDRLGANDYVKETIRCDASKVQLEDAEQFDIVIIECLQHLLAREPQVAITCNLIPQLREDVVLIPEEISLYPVLVDMSMRQKHMLGDQNIAPSDYYKRMPPVFTIHKDAVRQWNDEERNADLSFPEMTTKLTSEDTRFSTVALATDIKVYKEELLTMDNSGLTVPKVIAYMDAPDEVKAVKTQYVLGKSPQLKAHLIK